MSTVSVALCTYNGAAHLSAQLESLLAQTRLPDELVVGDDGSTDATVRILEEFAVRAPFPVRITVNERNLGSSRNFGETMSRCQGDFIALCDQDDVWLPAKLAKLVAVLESRLDVGLVFSDAELVDDNLQPLGRRLWEITFPAHEHEKFQRRWFDVLYVHEVVTGATMAFRSSLRDIVLPIPSFPTIIHDGWATFIIGTVASLAFVPEPLILYRQHAAQQMGVGLTGGKKSSVENTAGVPRERIRGIATREVNRLNEMLLVLDEVNRRLEERGGASAAYQHGQFRRGARQRIHDVKALTAHYEVRQQLPLPRLRRILPIVQELRTCRYHRFSRGFLSALKDILT